MSAQNTLRERSKVVFCCTLGFFYILSLCLQPSCPQLPAWMQQSHHHCQIMLHLNSSPSSCWFTFHSAFNNFMQKSVVSQHKSNPSMFPLPNRIQYLPVFIYSPENFLISNFIKPADLFHSSLYPHFKGFSNLLLSVCVNVHVSAAYSATLQTKHFVILFFSSRFILPVGPIQFLFLFF